MDNVMIHISQFGKRENFFMTAFYQKIIAIVMSLIMIPSGSLFLLGKKFDTSKKFEVILDEGTHNICEEIKNNSYVDIEGIVKEFPDVSGPMKSFNKAFNIDATAFREKMFKLRDEARNNGQVGKGDVYHFIGAYVSTFKSCTFLLEPRDDINSEIFLDVEYGDGVHEKLYTGVIYNSETGEIYDEGKNGLLGIGFCFNLNELVLYAVVNCWMRDYGFFLGYDLFCYMTPIFFYHTRRFKFDYAGKEWMIQAWKGLYAVSMGGEVGLYNREKGSLGTYYESAKDDEMINMTLEIYHGDELILKRDKQPHWWANGFKLSKTLYTANDLTLKATLEMKDEEMLKAFCESIDSNVHQDVSYTVDGLNVTIVW